MRPPKSVLLTGGAGFIGSHLADAFVERGYDVTVLDDLSTGRRENINPRVRFVEGDLRDETTLRLLDRAEFDLISHQAAQADLGRSVREPELDEAINVRASFRLLQKALDRGVKRFVFASSGGGIYGEPEFTPQSEEHPTKAPSPYGAAKLVVEQYIDYLRRVRKLSAVSLRYANVYGPRQRGDGEAGVVAIFLTRLLRGEDLMINGRGTQTRDFTFVGDVVKANLEVSENDLQGTFNVGTGQETSINSLADALEEITGRKARRTWREDVYAGQERSVIDGGRLRAAAALPDPIGLHEGLRLTADWFAKKRS
jgi:UDP-glucose 4-epimerase